MRVFSVLLNKQMFIQHNLFLTGTTRLTERTGGRGRKRKRKRERERERERGVVPVVAVRVKGVLRPLPLRVNKLILYSVPGCMPGQHNTYTHRS